MTDWRGIPVVPSGQARRRDASRDARPTLPQRVEVADATDVVIGRLAQGRHVVDQFTNPTCHPPADASVPPEVNECVNGTNADRFPATTVLLTATVTDPNAEHWDPTQNRVVRGPMDSTLFYQFGGIHPDLNKNGVDDFLDILRGNSRDRNHDGVPDDAVSGNLAAWWILLVVVVILLASRYRRRVRHS